MAAAIGAGVLALVGGCPRGEEEPARPAASAARPAPVSQQQDVPADERSSGAATEASEESAEPEWPAGPSEEASPYAEPDLGPPLVEHPENLEKLHPSYPVWFDKGNKSVVLVGAVCQRYVPLELFACLRGSKEHESVVVVAAQAYVVHAGLLAAGAEPGAPVQFRPEYAPPSGSEIEVEVIWRDEKGDEKGQVQRCRAQDWIRSTETGGAMTLRWVFAGSRFETDTTTGERFYLADVTGELICVSNFPSAVLDVPVESTDADASLLFEAYAERIPPRGTPVTLVLTPRPDGEVAPQATPEEAEGPMPEAQEAGPVQPTP